MRLSWSISSCVITYVWRALKSLQTVLYSMHWSKLCGQEESHLVSLITAIVAVSNSPSRPPSAWVKHALNHPLADLAISMETLWPRQSTAFAKLRLSTKEAIGKVLMTSNTRLPLAVSGSTTVACFRRLEISLLPSTKTCIINKPRLQQHDSNRTVSDKVRVIQVSVSFDRISLQRESKIDLFK